MKSEIIKKASENKQSEFPVLMESVHNGTVIMFTDYNTGVVVNVGNSRNTIGEHCTSLISCNSDHWKPFTGTIQLSND